MKRRVQIVILIALFGGASCDRGELPVPAHDPGEVVTVQVEMGADYRHQIFYDLGSQSIVSSNLKDIWDLGFSTHADEWRIVLNDARGGAVSHTGVTDFAMVTDTIGAEWRHDTASDHPDSTAFGNVQNTDEVFLLDRGYDHQGDHTGFRKLKVSLSGGEYRITTAALDGSGAAEILIPKDNSLNLVSVSLDQNAVVPVEPDRTTWDILFTQYTYIFDDPPLAYLVTGALINRENTQVVQVIDQDFDAITFGEVENYTFTNAADGIGYNWKAFDFGSGNYTVFPDMVYLVRDHEGRFFKLHFIDFYTENGEKGAPRMEIQEL